MARIEEGALAVSRLLDIMFVYAGMHDSFVTIACSSHMLAMHTYRRAFSMLVRRYVHLVGVINSRRIQGASHACRLSPVHMLREGVKGLRG